MKYLITTYHSGEYVVELNEKQVEFFATAIVSEDSDWIVTDEIMIRKSEIISIKPFK